MTKEEREEATYEAGCQATYDVVARWKIFGPPSTVWMPPRECALLADVLTVRDSLFRDEGAQHLCDALIRECKDRGLEDVPTVMMLLVCMNRVGFPYKEVPVEDLRLKPFTLIRRDQRGQA